MVQTDEEIRKPLTSLGSYEYKRRSETSVGDYPMSISKEFPAILHSPQADEYARRSGSGVSML